MNNKRDGKAIQNNKIKEAYEKGQTRNKQ